MPLFSFCSALITLSSFDIAAEDKLQLANTFENSAKYERKSNQWNILAFTRNVFYLWDVEMGTARSAAHVVSYHHIWHCINHLHMIIINDNWFILGKLTHLMSTDASDFVWTTLMERLFWYCRYKETRAMPWCNYSQRVAGFVCFV